MYKYVLFRPACNLTHNAFLSEYLYSSYVMPSPKESNPFLFSEKKEDPTLDIALQALAIETSRRTASEPVPLSQGVIRGGGDIHPIILEKIYA